MAQGFGYGTGEASAARWLLDQFEPAMVRERCKSCHIVRTDRAVVLRSAAGPAVAGIMHTLATQTKNKKATEHTEHTEFTEKRNEVIQNVQIRDDSYRS